jgi:thiamine-phosphate pyrophosphorylase
VTDRRISKRPLEEAVAAAVSAGVDWVQLRERDLGGAALLALARRVLDAARAAAATRPGGPAGAPLRFLVNRRVDVALAVGADGAHLGFDAMAPADARRLLGPRACLGVATHGADEVRAARAAGVDYVHLAPIFPPISKATSGPTLGLEGLRAATTYGVRVIAQGGIDAERAAAILEAGAAGVAVTGAILGAADPARAAAALREALGGGRGRPKGSD